MTKPITTFFIAFVLLCNILNGQCNVGDPEEGLLITKSTFLCGDVMNNYQGKLPSVNSPTIGQPASLCEGFPGGGGQPDNILWFSFIATSFNLDIDIVYGNCGSFPGANIQVGIYGDTEFNEKVVCNYGPMSSPANLSTGSVIPGKIYYLYIDGWQSPTFDFSTCDFEIVVNSGVADAPYTFDWKDDISVISAVEDDVLIQDQHNVCSGNNISYFYEAPICEAKTGAFNLDSFSILDLYCYEWTIMPSGSGVIVGDPNAREVEIDWQVPGDYTLSVEIFPGADIDACSPDLCLNAGDIQVSSIDITSMTAPDTIFFCADSPVTYCGELITESTSRTCIETTGNCVEVMQVFELLENDTIDYGTYGNCGSSGCFEIFGFEYCVPMDYLIKDPDQCNIYHRFTIEGFNIEIDLPQTLSLDCSNNNLTVNPAIRTSFTGDLTIEWFLGGNLVGSDLSLAISETGVYEIKVSSPDLEEACFGRAEVEIVESVDAPDFEIINPILTCADPSGTIEFIEIDGVSSISWEGPNGFSSSSTSFVTNESGSYKLSITGSNGCTNDTTFVISEDKTEPTVEVTYQDLTCLVIETTAELTSDQMILSTTWEDTNGDIFNDSSLVIADAGDYNVTVVSANGCSTVVPFDVLENTDMPTADAGQDQMWQCNTVELTLEGNISNGPNDLSWTVVEQGLIKTDATLSSIDVGSEGTYILNVTNRESSCFTSDSVTVFRNEDVPDAMETSIVDPSCFNTADGMVQVLNVEGGTAPFRYYLNGIQSQDDFIDDLSAGVYSLLVLDGFDCRLEVQVEVEEQPEIILDMPTSVTIGYNELFTFWAIHNLLPDDLQEVNWYNENGNLIGKADSLDFKTIENTIITVEVFNQNGCSTLRSIPIEVDINLPVFAPNVFSPNEDGFNDKFILYANGDYPLQVTSLRIFNRWGEQVYFVENVDFGDESRGWDGTKNGKILENAVFAYTAEVQLVDGSIKIIKGEVTLIR
jgi:gliding motility-associated-like protein